MGANYSPGRIEGLPPAAQTSIKELWDRINWLIGEMEKLKAGGGSGGTGSTQAPSQVNIPAIGDSVMQGMPQVGGLVGGAENWGLAKVILTADADRIVNLGQDPPRTMEVTSSISLTATRSIIVPRLAGKVWIVFNGTAGGQALTFKLSGSTGVTVANNRRAIVYCDGIDVRRVTPDTAP